MAHKDLKLRFWRIKNFYSVQNTIGENNTKEVFNLSPSGFNEDLILRFDQTLPFMRHICVNKIPREGLTRYSIGPVFRNDTTNQKSGRFRQFEQADFDIATENHSEMVPDLLTIEAMLDGLDKIGESFMGENDFTVKINDRRVLNKVFEKSGFEESNFSQVAGALDKLDKTCWDRVQEELVNADFGQTEVCNLKSNIESLTLESSGSNELQKLFNLAANSGSIRDRIEFSPTLARGLDYYTGIIFEAFDQPKTRNSANNKSTTSLQPVSIAGGGRYDNLSSTLTNGKIKTIKSVGMSIGLERLASLNQFKNEEFDDFDKSVYIVTPPVKENLLSLETEKMKLASRLRAHGFEVTFSFKMKSKMLTQFQMAEGLGIGNVVVIGPEEIENGSFKMRKDRQDETLNFDELVERLTRKH